VERKSKMSTEKKCVHLTTLTINPEETDWTTLQKNVQLYRYKVRPKSYNEKYYYAKIHNWYKTVCDDPCYFNTYDQHIYVLYPPSKEAPSLTYKDDNIAPQPVGMTNPDMLHALVKTLVSKYFHTHETFISNADFFLPVTGLKTDFITVLRIRMNQSWNNPDEFLFKDEAKILRKLQGFELDKFWANTNYYGVDFDQNGDSIFRQLRYKSIRLIQKRRGVYVLPRKLKTRAQVTYHTVQNFESLKKSRSYVLNKFFNGLLDYLNQLGLPFKHKELEMQEIDVLKGKEMKKPQISIGDKPVYIVDDRMRPTIKPHLEPDNFTDDFCTVMQSLLSNMKKESPDKIFGDKIPTLNLGQASQLPAGSYVLRIEDNEKDDFKNSYKIDPDTKIEELDELALFNGYGEDPMAGFYKTYSNLVIQTLNVNDNTRIRNEENKRKKKSKSHKKWEIDTYLSYGQPDVKNTQFRNRVEVCLNQLILKDIVMHPQRASVLIPQEQLEVITNKVFMYLENLMYFDGTELIFMRVTGNAEAQGFIKRLTGKDLRADILKPAMKWYNKYQFSEEDAEDDDKVSQTFKKGRFIISEDYAWQIVDSPERMLYPDDEIEVRLENLAEKRPIKDFYPKFPLTGDEPFTEQQLREYENFLKEYVNERYISYDELKDKYRHIKIKNEDGKMIKTGEGIYPALGISKDNKFKKYLREFLGLPTEEIRTKDVLSVSQGIWYEPYTQQYLVGSKDTRKIKQEKGFVLRQILVHSGNSDQEQLFNRLKTDFFPMLQVNFIRHKEYTVYPFPFNLIKMWREIHDSD